MKDSKLRVAGILGVLIEAFGRFLSAIVVPGTGSSRGRRR